MVEVHHHRSTLKQQNKSFKSKHATKSSLKEAAKGRVPGRVRQSPKAAASVSSQQARLVRRNKAKQAQLAKRASLLSAGRIFNGVDGAPRIVAIIPLTSDVGAKTISFSLAEVLDLPTDDLPDIGIVKLKAERFKTSLQLINVPYSDFYAAMDACKVADYVVFVASPVQEVDKWGETLLRAVQAQGLPDVVTVIPADSSVAAKARTGILGSLLSFIQYFVPTQTRVFDLHSNADKLNLVRSLAEGKPTDVRWREDRSWLLGESSTWAEGILSVTGVVRGSSLSANRLVHIPNFGDFQISKIVSAPLPRTKAGQTAMDIEPIILAEPVPSSADSLVSTNDPDDMANEQTWPTEEEMQGVDSVMGPPALPDAHSGTTPKRVRRIPKGMSEYQASWIVDDEDEDDEDGIEDGEQKENHDSEPEEEMEDLPMEQDDATDAGDTRSVMFQDLDQDEEEAQLKNWRNRKREEEDDAAFPDELDTPQDIAARIRFQRFRGLRSFRTSPWDPFENLPRDYARIFQFEDYKRTERNVRRRADQELGVVEPGIRVTVHLTGVPAAAGQQSPIALFALLQHEHKVSVLNFTVHRDTEYDGSVRSKDPLIICVGPRRLKVNPVYSQHTRGGGKGVNNVHKFERYLRHGVTSVATIYGPVVFGKQPCVLLRETSDSQAPQLVATGTFLDPDTTRVIAKRIVLTGHPFKVHKKTATVRYMFFNREDIQYFKPIQLTTKHGRVGHIRESLGTHGYFKAHFDGPISQMDTVCMTLYKRVYPKWASIWERPTVSEMRPMDAMEE
ncbi:ribosome biogenesis protein tsr1 [Mycena floridula]|nr:ribosome biogenesis protein tsr1 [Mycena floridula]